MNSNDFSSWLLGSNSISNSSDYILSNNFPNQDLSVSCSPDHSKESVVFKNQVLSLSKSVAISTASIGEFAVISTSLGTHPNFSLSNSKTSVVPFTQSDKTDVTLFQQSSVMPVVNNVSDKVSLSSNQLNTQVLSSTSEKVKCSVIPSIKSESPAIITTPVLSDSSSLRTNVIKNEIHEVCTDQSAKLPALDVKLHNVVVCYSTRCHLNLKKIALEGRDVILKQTKGFIYQKLRNPSSAAQIRSSGKIVVTGANSVLKAKQAARKVARRLQKLGFDVTRLHNYRIVNILATCSLAFGVKLHDFAKDQHHTCLYEPELNPGVTWWHDKSKSKTTKINIFSTGNLTIITPSVNAITPALLHLYPILQRHSKPLTPEQLARRQSQANAEKYDVLSKTPTVDLHDYFDKAGPSSSPTLSGQKRSRTSVEANDYNRKHKRRSRKRRQDEDEGDEFADDDEDNDLNNFIVGDDEIEYASDYSKDDDEESFEGSEHSNDDKL